MDLHYHDGKHWRPWVGVFVAGAATMATHKREWRCDECGATWTDEDKAETVN
jgi:transposase-like protein